MSQFTDTPPQTRFVQLHGTDFLVRLQEGQLYRIEFEHLESVQDPNVFDDARRFYGDEVVKAGFSEWHGTNGSVVVSLAWDWCQVPFRAPFLLQDSLPRTNLRLVDARGYDLQMQAAKAAFFFAIQQLPWIGFALAALPSSAADENTH